MKIKFRDESVELEADTPLEEAALKRQFEAMGFPDSMRFVFSGAEEGSLGAFNFVINKKENE